VAKQSSAYRTLGPIDRQVIEMSVILKEMKSNIDDEVMISAWQAGKLEEVGKALEKKLGFSIQLTGDKKGVYADPGTDTPEVLRALKEYFMLENAPAAVATSAAAIGDSKSVAASGVKVSPEVASAPPIEMSELLCVITLNDEHPVFTDKQIAREWLRGKLTSNSCKEALVKVSCLSKGRALKLHMTALPKEVLNTEVLPKFQQLGSVKQFDEEQKNKQMQIDKDFAASKRKKADAVGDLTQTSSLLEAFNQMHGRGGSEKKARQFARNGISILKLSQTVAASGLKEAAKKADSSSDED
jgi:hypothetical protein